MYDFNDDELKISELTNNLKDNNINKNELLSQVDNPNSYLESFPENIHDQDVLVSSVPDNALFINCDGLTQSPLDLHISVSYQTFPHSILNFSAIQLINTENIFLTPQTISDFIPKFEFQPPELTPQYQFWTENDTFEACQNIISKIKFLLNYLIEITSTVRAFFRVFFLSFILFSILFGGNRDLPIIN